MTARVLQPAALLICLLLPFLASAPGAAESALVQELGMLLERVATGVEIKEVAPGSAAFRAGIRKGQVVLAVDGVEVAADPEEVRGRMLAVRSDPIRLLIRPPGGGKQELLLPRPLVSPPAAAGEAPAPAPVTAPSSRPIGSSGGPAARGPQSAGRPEVIARAEVKVGGRYLDFTLPRLGGGEVRLKELIGKPIFIDFWATWCPPCRAEAPALAALHERFQDRIHMLGISLDYAPAAPLQYAIKHGLDYPQLMADGGPRDPVVKAYGVDETGIPFNFLIDAGGTVVALDLHGEPLVRAIEALLAANPPPRP